MSRKSPSTETTWYLLKDHLGSVAKILNGSGAEYVSESFAAFGARRDPSDWSGACPCPDLDKIKSITRRGFTEHEMIGGQSMGLIHMNGRVQDSITGRFLSADPFIQAPFDSQSLNRYSYVFNNPLSAIDPSGFRCWWMRYGSGGVEGHFWEAKCAPDEQWVGEARDLVGGGGGGGRSNTPLPVEPRDSAVADSTTSGVPSQNLSDALYLAGPIPAARFNLGMASLTANGGLNLINSVGNGTLNFLGAVLQPLDAYAGEIITLETSFPGGGIAVGPTMALGHFRVAAARHAGM